MRIPRAVAALLAAVAVGVAAAACSSPSSSSPSSSTPAASASGAAATGSTSYPLTITQPDGTKAVIKSRPTRIVTVDNPQESMDDVVALGVEPVGGLTYPAGTAGFDSRGIPTEISSQIHSSFTSVGTAPSDPDLDTIAALHPDLIVGVDGTGTADLKQLEAIAPVVSPTPATPSGTGIGTLEWVSELQLLGKVLDRQPEANSFIAKFEAAAAPVRKAVAGTTVDLVLPLAAGSTFTLIGSRFQPAGHLLAYLGLSLPDSFPGAALTSGGTHGTYSMERVGVLTGQYLVLAHTVSSNSAVYTQFLANALVKKLPSVKAGHVIETEGDESFGSGYLTAGAVGQLDALPAIQKAFAG